MESETMSKVSVSSETITTRSKPRKKSKVGPPKANDDLCGPFYITAGFILLAAVTLTTVSVWSFLRKLPYYVLLEVRVDIPYFMLPAGILCFPCFWIVVLMKRNVQYILRFFHLLLLLQLISCGLLIAGACIKMIYSNRVGADSSNLTTSLDVPHLNASLKLSMLDYSNVPVKLAWDKVQQRFNCCGTAGYDDWNKTIQDVPDSCYGDTGVFQQGCIGVLNEELVWQRNFVSSHCYMGTVVHLIGIIVFIAVYYMNMINR